LLNLYPAAGAVDPAHVVAQVALVSPQWHELKQSWLFGNIVAGSFALAAGANRAVARAGTHLGDHGQLPFDAIKPYHGINKTLDPVTGIEQSLYLHRRSFRSDVFTPRTQRTSVHLSSQKRKTLF